MRQHVLMPIALVSGLGLVLAGAPSARGRTRLRLFSAEAGVLTSSRGEVY
jgi:hypothetical protein